MASPNYEFRSTAVEINKYIPKLDVPIQPRSQSILFCASKG